MKYTYAHVRLENIFPFSGVKNLISHRLDMFDNKEKLMDLTCRALGRMESRECILMAYVREGLTAFIYLRLDLRPTQRKEGD